MKSDLDTSLIKRLCAENDELREEIRQLRERVLEKLGHETFPRSWKIGPTIRSILLDLSSGSIVPLLTLWQNAADRYPTSVGVDRKRSNSDGVPDDPIGVVRVQVSRSRRALADLGIEICSSWGQGYYLPPESLEIVRKALGRGSARSDEQEQEQCPEA